MYEEGVWTIVNIRFRNFVPIWRQNKTNRRITIQQIFMIAWNECLVLHCREKKRNYFLNNISTDWTRPWKQLPREFSFSIDCSNFQRRILITPFSTISVHAFPTCVQRGRISRERSSFARIRDGFDGEADIVFHVARSCEDRDGEEMRKGNFSRRIILY